MSVFDGSAASYVRFWVAVGSGFLLAQGVLLYVVVTRPILKAFEEVNRAGGVRGGTVSGADRMGH